MSTFSRPVQDLLIATGYATETTAKTFLDSASVGEVVVLNKNGQEAASYGADAYILGKDSKGLVKASDTLIPGKIKSVTLKAPTTIVPAYASWTVSVSGLTAGDIYKGLMRIPNYGSQSVNDELLVPFSYMFTSGGDVDTVSEGLITSLTRNLARAEGKYGQKFVNFKTGYADVFTTEAAVIAGKAGLTNGTLIYVLQNNKPYTVADKTALTFATIATEKTDWSTELGNGSAEYLFDNPWFAFVKKDGASPLIYIVAKEQTMVDNKIEGYPITFKVGLEVLDGTSFETNSTITVTQVGRVGSAGEGRNIRRLETFTKGHTGDFYRGMGYPNNFDNYYDSSTSTNYYMVSVEFYFQGNDVNILTTGPQNKLIQIACADSTTADSVYAALNALVTPALGDLRDVDLATTAPTDGQVIKFEDTDSTWYPADDATA